MNTTKRHIKLLLLLAAGLLAACGPDVNPPQPETQDEIRLDASIWQMMQGAPSRRVSTYDDQAAIQGDENGFRCYAYNAETTTPYINGSIVTWETNKWVFSDGKHYWPASGALDFFCYMPAEVPNYIKDNSDESGSVTYVARNPQFKCTLPMTHAGQDGSKEFIYAIASDQDKAGTNSSVQPTPGKVALSFKHPFAKIVLKLSSSQEALQINKITLKSIKNNGTYTHSSGWALTGDATNFVAELNENHVANDVLGTYLMVPQGWAGEIEVVATWIDWGELFAHTLTTKLDPVTWQAGYSYTYTFTITTFDLRVDVDKFTEQW